MVDMLASAPVKTALLPPSAFLPACPVRLPDHEPRSGRGGIGVISDKAPEQAEGHFEALYPFPKGKEMKWLTYREIVTELVGMGYDEDLARSVNNIVERVNYHHLRPYYMHKEQARRNLARQRAREAAEKLVGTQTPPAQD